MDVHPTKNVSIGIDPYPHLLVVWDTLQDRIALEKHGVRKIICPDFL
jgi:hypothetical protein